MLKSVGLLLNKNSNNNIDARVSLIITAWLRGQFIDAKITGNPTSQENYHIILEYVFFFNRNTFATHAHTFKWVQMTFISINEISGPLAQRGMLMIYGFGKNAD